MRHQKGADSLRLRLLLMETMMFCLQYSGSLFATTIPGALASGDDIEIPMNVYYDL